MNLQKLIFTENACYKAGNQIVPKGIMVHSTGANNPTLKRYVGPDDGKLGKNIYGNHWNTAYPGGSKVCVHAFIGQLADGTVATYQTLPWYYRGWHAGGSANDTHIGFEICEDNLKDAVYFGKVYQEAVELCAYLCQLYNLTEKDIIDHSEGAKKGIASGHGDVGHWFPKHGKNMTTFRADVKALLDKDSATAQKPTEEAPKETAKTLYRVQVGSYSNRDNAQRLLDQLKAAGFTGYITTVNASEGAPAPEAKPQKSVEEIAREVLAGKWGNGSARKKKLTAAGYDYDAVQAAVNKLLK